MKDYTRLTVKSKRPTQSRGNERIRLILQIASDLFSKHGVANVTTNQIATAASIPVGSIYTYFENKDKIVESLLELYHQDLGMLFAKMELNPILTDMSWHEILTLVMYTWNDYLTQNKSLNCIVYARSVPELRSSVVKGRIQLQNNFCTIFHKKLPKNNLHDDSDSLCKVVFLQLTATVEYAQVMSLDENQSEKFILASVGLLATSLPE